ncbi:MAG: uracil-DNA glycosylase [Bdellovibrio sp.]|nr:uracil-DNA glycosylase [Bdellovibrio sp.]
MKGKLHESWQEHLGSELSAPYMLELKSFLALELAKKKIIYPHGRDIFNAFNFTPFDQVKVVIIGQDPYHGPGQAHGLCFSVLPDIPIPPSLANIYKEISDEFQTPVPNHGCLIDWAKQGVLLLNTTLTVEQHRAMSHAGKGWEKFTDRVVEVLNSYRQNLVFLLWGSHAQKKAQNVDRKKHLVLTAPHPSPLSAYRGFFGCGHFKVANQYLNDQGAHAINWSV